MSDPRERLEEYADGLLSAEEAGAVEAALARDPELRKELDRVVRFRQLLSGLGAGEREVERILGEVRRVRRWRGRVAWAAAAAAAALLLWFGARSLWQSPSHEEDLSLILRRQALAFGERLGAMAGARRQGRVPRIGVGDLEVPTAAYFGVVFEGALNELGVGLKPGVERQVKDEVSRHFRRMRSVPEDVAGQYRRSEASLELFRKLRSIGGREVADAYYDVFRPGLADLRTVLRLPAGSLGEVISGPEARERYLRAYEEAIARLDRRYGRPKVELVLSRLAPADRRQYWRDAAEDGVGRDAVLEIRVHLYRAAAESGADKLYVNLRS